MIVILLFISSNQAFSQDQKIEGKWLVYNTENDCDDNESGLYMIFENNTMQTLVRVGRIDPIPYAEKLIYQWEDKLLIVTKKESALKYKYTFKIKGKRMKMTHLFSKTTNYFESR